MDWSGVIVTASYDGTAKTWCVATGTRLQTLAPNTGRNLTKYPEGASEHEMMSAVFSRDGRLVLTASYDGVCSLTGACKKSLKGQGDDNSGLYTAFFSPDESRVLTASASGVARLWRIADGRCEWELHGHDSYMRYATFSQDGKRLATASADHDAKLWRIDPDGGVPQLEATLLGHNGWLNTIVFSPDGSSVLTSAADSTAKLWCSSSGKVLLTFAGHKGWVRSAIFSPDLTYVLTCSFDCTAALWNSKSGDFVRAFFGHEYAVSSAIFSTDGECILTSSRDSTARLWRASTGECLRTIKGHDHFVISAHFAPQSTLTAFLKQNKRKALEASSFLELSTLCRICLCRRRRLSDNIDQHTSGFAQSTQAGQSQVASVCPCGVSSGGWANTQGQFFCSDCWNLWRGKQNPESEDGKNGHGDKKAK
eukprot:TRINITY_DN6483_c0_g1_i1.p1 TRINITY_DN6483_c0_g1~~TRINITY_DN6483_c0_g1_i1.p1  ORF type:complete len:423 (-),score=25.44 TRINITY_DN6483_c0_g1_i1:45-1313(-)